MSFPRQINDLLRSRPWGLVLAAVLLAALANSVPSPHSVGAVVEGTNVFAVSASLANDSHNGHGHAQVDICLDDASCTSFGTLPTTAEVSDFFLANIPEGRLFTSRGTSPPPDIPPPVHS